jgi:hypothetical protein
MMLLLRALRRRRYAQVLERHRKRVLRWAARAAAAGRPWSPETVERIARAEAARHGACCVGHREFERRVNRRWAEAGPAIGEWEPEDGE